MGTRGTLTAIAAAMAMLIGSSASALTKDEQKCIDGYNNKLRLVSQQAGKGARACVKNAGKGAEADAENCMQTNPDGKIAGKEAKVAELYSGGKCTGSEPIQQGAAAGNLAHREGIEDLAHDVFGANISAPVFSPGDKDIAKCQDKAIQRATQAFTQIMKSHRKCKKTGMKALTINDEASLQATCGSFAQIDADAKASGKLTKLSGDVAAACGAPTVIATHFPGECSGAGSAAALGTCLATATKCRACETINEADGTNQDCDLFDDGVANASCSAPVACPIAPGAYTITQLAGGTLAVSIFPAFPFPAGGSIVQDVGAGDANCVHDTVVPVGGFNAPIFCIPALGLYTEIQQTGCGVGRIDSDGGSDFTVTENGDTSDSSATCSLPHAGCVNGADSSIRVDVTVGNGAADTCGSGTANAIVAIPVFTRTWSDASGGSAIPPCAGDGVFDGGDTIITQFPQILDFTTDTNTAAFVDIDGDLCSKAGLEGPGGKSGTGVCLDIGAGTITTAAAGTIGSAGAPTYDLSFSTVLTNSISGPAAPLGATCPSPPIINFTGAATRCIP